MNIRDYFSFTRSERRGSLVLTSLLFILICFRLIGYSTQVGSAFDYHEFEQEITAFLDAQEQRNPNTTEVNYFPFNPNTISDEQWKQLGFKPWQISAIQKYKDKGGTWKIKRDVSRIYGLSKEQYDKLAPYIQLPDKLVEQEKNQPHYFSFNPNNTSPIQFRQLGFKSWQIENIKKFKASGGSWKTKEDFSELYGMDQEHFRALSPYIDLPERKHIKRESFSLNINTATESDLILLKGINSNKYASIILNYREKLGGFIKKEQLLEVWGMKQETYDRFKPQIIIDTTQLRQLNINTLSAKELVKHPYISWNLANSIEKYKKAHGQYQEIGELRSLHLMTDTLYQKIAPYLKIKE